MRLEIKVTHFIAKQFSNWEWLVLSIQILSVLNASMDLVKKEAIDVHYARKITI